MLVWTTRFAGMPGDPLAKSPHMARIAGSVYPDVSQEGFYVDEMGRPSESMRESLLYKLHSFGMQAEVPELEKYEEVYTSKYKMVRIWKVLDVDEESKRGGGGREQEVRRGGMVLPRRVPGGAQRRAQQEARLPAVALAAPDGRLPIRARRGEASTPRGLDIH